MMSFIHDDFLLDTEVARELYHGVAADLPIIDFHNHLSPKSLADNRRFRSITEVWLGGDHYKWRAMRANGVPERLCTGDASDWEKFEAWARTVPETLGNPLFHWTAMELRRPFGIEEPLSPSNARSVFERCNERLTGGSFTAQGLLQQFAVAVACTTDDPANPLDVHRVLVAREDPVTRVFPTWRPDGAMSVEDPVAWNAWVGRLERASDSTVGSWEEFLLALEKRHRTFHELGCRLSDHGLEVLPAGTVSEAIAGSAFDRLRSGKGLHRSESETFRTTLLHWLALLDHDWGWVQQFHLGPMRNICSRLYGVLGTDSGHDSIGDFRHGRPLARFLDRLDKTEQLAKTILYNLNPADTAIFATMAGNFQDGSLPGKMQLGPAWWFLDNLDGMEIQLRTLANMGLLSRFVGMSTDSRSFLSFSRHDYFRRLLCRILGEDVRRGLLPNDLDMLSRLVANVSFFNARDYFGLRLGSVAGSFADEPLP
jgi:glucuronate isomerase